MDEGTNKPGDIYNVGQYEMLKRCSDNKDLSEWNNWREENRKEEIWLVGANFEYACLQGADLLGANLKDAELYGVELQNAILREACLQGVDIRDAYLQGANLISAKLQGAYLRHAELQGAKLVDANLQGADLAGASLQGASFIYAIVDGKTLIASCMIDKDTDFAGVGLDSARVEPGLKQLLEYNIRRKRWEEYYKDHRWSSWFLRRFWNMSDYGRSTKRILWTFVKYAFCFTILYLAVGYGCLLFMGNGDAGLVQNLFTYEAAGEIHEVSHWVVPVRAFYFSVVTMTTLGFGDIYANPAGIWMSICGHLVLGTQVMLGYILLGALITRFAILFTSGGPAGKFTKKTP